MRLFLILNFFLVLGCAQNGVKGYKGHGADSIDPEVVKKFAPKPLPSDKLARIEALLDVRSPGMGQLTPDGKHLFFTWSVTGNRQVWKISKNRQFPVQMTGGQDSTSLRDITPDGKYLVLTRDEKGNEYPYLYLQNVNGGPLRLVAGQKKVITSPQFVTKDSKFLYYTMNNLEPTLHSLYRINLKTWKKEQVFKGIKGYMFVVDHRGDDLVLGNAKGNTAREYYLFNVKTKKLTNILGQDENESYSVAMAPRKGEYIVQTNKFGEFQRLYLLKKGEFKPITAKMKYNVSGFSLDENRTRILYSVNKEGYMEAKAMTARSFKPISIPIKRGKGVLHTYLGSTTPNSRYTVMGVVKANQPFSSYVYDWNTKKLKQWVYPSSPEISTVGFVEPKLDYYTSRDGTKIPMFVKRPKQCTPNKGCPVIVRFHGGPEGQHQPRFSPTDELYMEEGFILVSPNVRGSSGYGKSWLHSDNGPKRLKVITDIEDAAKFIKKNWAVNGKVPKIGVMGGSYGGYSTNVAMTMFAGAYDAGVSIVGMSSLVTFLENTGPYRRHLRTSEYGDPAKDMEALEKLSPVNYLDKIKDPMLVIHGATDPRVPVGEAIQIYEAMSDKGLDGELIVFADEGHGVRKRKNRAIYFGHTMEFFKKHLL
jgi:dipeptidyl aminopeptidase/acylaminoacyl peptidase